MPDLLYWLGFASVSLLVLGTVIVVIVSFISLLGIVGDIDDISKDIHAIREKIAPEEGGEDGE